MFTLDPKLGSAHFRLGQVLLYQAFLLNIEMWSDPKGERQAASTKQALEGTQEFRIAQKEGSSFDSELQREVAAAMLAYLQNKPDAVREICRRSIDRFGDREGSEEFYWLLGVLPGTPVDRIAVLDKAIEIKPMFPLAFYTRANAWSHVGTPEGNQKSLDDWSQAILIHPDFAEAYIFRGSIALAKPDVPAAMADFNKAIALGRRQAAAYNGRAAIRLNVLKDLDGAIADCDEAIRLQPDDYGMPYFNRAVAYYRKRNYDAALRDGAKMIETKWTAGMNEMRWLRAKCFDAKGDAEGALEEVRRLVEPGATPQDVVRRMKLAREERLKDEAEPR